MDREEGDAAESVVQFNLKQLNDILNKVNDLQNLVLSKNTVTERALKIPRGLIGLFFECHKLHRQL